jgi:carbonyl reductase 1
VISLNMSNQKVAIVSGGNKGIGLGVVKGLAEKFEGAVYLTARNVERGTKSVKELEQAGINVFFHQLDIEDKSSIEKFRDYIKEKYGGIDVLVNNAGIAFKAAATEPMHVQAKVTIKTNYFGTKQACDLLFPILKPGARVVNVSSSAGFLLNVCGDEPAAGELRKKLASSDSTLNAEELDSLMKQFIEAAEDGTFKEKGWGGSTYVASKVGLSALSRIQQRLLLTDARKDIAVNHVHPGYVDTDMTSHKGPLTVEDGAKSSLMCALLPPNTDIKGKYFWYDCKEVDWVNGPRP